MARIIRLTEQDLARIVRRVIREDDGAIKSAAEKAAKTASSLIRNGGDEKATNCSQLDGKISDEIFGITKSMVDNVAKGGVAGTASFFNGKYVNGIPVPDWVRTTYNEDPYSYVELFNGKYCVKHYEKRNWIEVTDTKQIEAVRKKFPTS